MATVYEIIQGINQAAANAYDGAHDKRYSSDGEDHKIGLKREEGDCIIDSRVMDGFGVKFHGDKLIITYQSEIKLKDFHDRNFEDDTKQALSDIAKFLKKEYKKITGASLTLTSEGDVEIHAQTMSRVRSWVQAQQTFKIGGMKETEEVKGGTPEDRLDSAIKSFLSIGKDEYSGAKKSQNVTIK